MEIDLCIISYLQDPMNAPSVLVTFLYIDVRFVRNLYVFV